MHATDGTRERSPPKSGVDLGWRPAQDGQSRLWGYWYLRPCLAGSAAYGIAGNGLQISRCKVEAKAAKVRDFPSLEQVRTVIAVMPSETVIWLA